MKKLTLALFAPALSAAAFAGPAFAQQQDNEPILVQPQAATEVFVQTVAHRLARQLDHVAIPRGAREGGIVRVSFFANGRGEAEDVTILERSPNADIDSAAVSAVSRIRHLGPSPLADRQEVHATIIFALSEREERQLTEQALEENAARVAAGEAPGSQVLALILAPNTRS
jgi:TonB family protein